MTNEEFEQWLRNEFNKHPILAKHIPHTINELLYVLRESKTGMNYDMSFQNPDRDGWTCIPCLDAFVPVRTLALHIININYEPEEYDGKLYRHLELEVSV